MSSRLPDSKRNELIAEYNEGKTNPDYEVIPSKTQKGKYTVRKRKVSLPSEENNVAAQDAPAQENTEPEDTQDEDPDNFPYYPQFNEEMMYRQYQAQLNQMMLEQMKLLRQNMKYSKYKQQKIKDKTNKIYGILSDAVSRATPEPEPEETPEASPDYPEPEPEPETEPEETPEPEASPNYPEQNYAQDYERDIDEMAGVVYKPYSRKDRINWKNFNI